MIKFNLEEFKQGKFGVQCETEEQAKDFLTYLKDNGIIYQAGENTLNYTLWENQKNNTYYRVAEYDNLVKGNANYSPLGVSIIKYASLDFTENNEPRYLEILKKAIETYGVNKQLDMAIEEMSELTKEICKFKRGGCNISKITEEIADVLIMIEQLFIMFDIGSDKVEDIVKYKIKRLAERLES